MFRRTISEEDKEEIDFVPEYAALVKVLTEFVNRIKGTAKWSGVFNQMQESITTFKKPLRTLDNNGACWKHTK